MDRLGAGAVVILVFVTLLGLAVGSFLNVVIHRVPAGESVVSPPSRCPNCGKPIRARHNLPVLGWLILKGRCADCAAPISARYPLVEMGTGLVFLAIAVTLAPALWPAFLCFAAIGIALALIDLDTRTLPSKIILPSYPVLAALLTVASAVQGDWWALARAGIGGAALFAFYFLLVLLYPAGMGFGDVRLSGILGGVLAYLSWSTLVVGAFGGFLLGAVAGVAVVVARRGDRKTALPFGPFMILGALVAVFVADPIAGWYLDLVTG
ncbi:Leader peptidase (Prepilin peptidase) / N-methyltransferase [Alloactinosynnema sp. L-07]|uniref:prepilin peptidase n=1 Tax=Alloactinosynnema sp. L-07 TaxID=1653480 RepID=UPI00065EFFC3|nr:A24 family peptidase [Alloactinosynnema sp. L-07]CRK54993.1 Leader peptidase (Prepilin peptidase) / N-methyltransferase [Alloactinosynnema sp. L-07]